MGGVDRVSRLAQYYPLETLILTALCGLSWERAVLKEHLVTRGRERDAVWSTKVRTVLHPTVIRGKDSGLACQCHPWQGWSCVPVSSVVRTVVLRASVIHGKDSGLACQCHP